MNIKQIETILKQGGIEPNEAKIEAKMLMKHFMNLSDKDLVMQDEFEELPIVIEKANERAQTRKPIQHIIGTAYFMGEDFIVNENVLIPRDETEILVRKAIELIDKLPSEIKTNAQELPRVLDIGTGSGCIACMIAKLSNVQVLGVDISLEALQVALDNATKLQLFNKALFRKSDIFSKIREGEKFDIIVSNPPYIPPSEKINIQEEVKYDPELALYTQDEKGLEFYERIINDAPDYLHKNGYLLFECGIGQAQEIVEMLKFRGFSDVEIIKDLADIDRVVLGKI